MVVRRKLVNRPTQVPFADRNDVIQAFLLYRPDEALRIRITVGRSWRRSNHTTGATTHPSREEGFPTTPDGRGAWFSFTSASGKGYVPGLLFCPQTTEIDIDVGFTEMQGLVYVCTNTMSSLRR